MELVVRGLFSQGRREHGISDQIADQISDQIAVEVLFVVSHTNPGELSCLHCHGNHLAGVD